MTETSQINAALAAVQSDLPHITKDQTANAGTYRYKYADLADVSLAIMPLLGKHGLSFTSRPTLHEGRFVLLYELRHESGEQIAGAYPLPDRGTPQEIGGQITYARRYCLCALTGVAPDEDDDAMAAQRAAERRERREDARSRRGGQPSNENQMSGEQQRKMQTLFQAAGIVEKADKLKYATEVVGRSLKTATELTHAEADKVIAALEKKVAAQAAKQSPPVDADAEAEKWLASQQPPAEVGAR